MPFGATSFLVGLAASAAIGIAAGIGGFTFFYANGASYITDDSIACANCHVMKDIYDGWSKSPHHAVAVCNDCHTPHGFVRKYAAKGLNGYHHSKAFTLGGFKEPIAITPRNKAVTEEQCRRCHGEMAAMIEGPQGRREGLSCLKCHRSVGHLH